MIRLCLGAIVAVQTLAPGLAAASLPSGPVVPTVLCTEHGPLQVLIDLGTGEPVETTHLGPCDLCLACCAVGLSSPADRHSPARALTSDKTLLPAHASAPAGLPLSYAAARGPPVSL